MSDKSSKSTTGDTPGSGYSDEQPDPNAPRPHGPGEGSPHDHQNDPKRKPATDPHESDKGG